MFGERSLSGHLQGFVDHYHQSRTHPGLDKDTPEPRRSRGRFNRRPWGALFRSRKSADSTIDASAAPRDDIFGAIPSALAGAPARAY